MAYLRNYNWDVFISYASADNVSYWSKDWVTDFSAAIKEEIERHLIGSVKIFFDSKSVKGSDTLTGILKSAEASGILLVVGSPNWVKSQDWCQKELNAFLAKHRSDVSRIFVAELDPPAGEVRYPAVIADKPHRRFWKASEAAPRPTPLQQRDRLYPQRLGQLADEIRERLMMLRDEPAEVSPPEQAGHSPTAQESSARTEPWSREAEPPAEKTGPYAGRRVFVAAGPAEVAPDRQTLIDYLDGKGVTIIELPVPRPETGAEFDSALSRALDSAEVYIQLLGPGLAEPPPGASESSTYSQFEAAQKRELPYFLWRPEAVDPETMGDADYRALLLKARIDGLVPTVAKAILGQLEEIQKEKEKPKPPPGRLPIKLVVSADPEDGDRAMELMSECQDRTCRVILDDFDLSDTVRGQWADAAAVAFVQGNAHRRWLAARYSAFDQARITQQVTSELKGQAVVYAPPPPKKKGTVSGGGLEEFDLSETWDLKDFRLWLDRIGAVKLNPGTAETP